jgi:arsenate reductase
MTGINMIKSKISFSTLLFFITLSSNAHGPSVNKLYPILNEYVKDFSKEFRKIPEDRRYRLNEIVYYLEEQEEQSAPWQLIFISTNESSVSQMAQVWSKVAAFYFDFPKFQSFSGGIKPLEIAMNSIVTMEKAGFIVYKTDISGINVYRVKYSYNLTPIVAFPKKIRHIKNPYDNFMAVLVEENADINISKIKGTYNRLLLNYEDPTGYEGSGLEDQYYEESCRTVAIEMFYIFSQLRKRKKED